MIHVTSEELETIHSTLGKALVLHEKWLSGLHRTFACKLPPSSDDMAENAHQRCAFGHWFYSKENPHLRELAAFKKIGDLHVAMHDSAREVCRLLEMMGKVPVKKYDELADHITQFREELISVQSRVSCTLQNIDSLTGAYNHSRLLPELKMEQQKLKAGGKPFSLLLMDIDLKTVNQKQGHDIGDQVLKSTISSIRDNLGPEDKVYRYEGAEFVISLPGKAVTEAEATRESLMKGISEALTKLASESVSPLNIYYSIVELNPDAYIEELLDRSARSTFTITL